MQASAHMRAVTCVPCRELETASLTQHHCTRIRLTLPSLNRDYSLCTESNERAAPQRPRKPAVPASSFAGSLEFGG